MCWSERTQQLADENRSLRQQQEQLAGERSQLLAKNEQARIARRSDDRAAEVAGAAHMTATATP